MNRMLLTRPAVLSAAVLAVAAVLAAPAHAAPGPLDLSEMCRQAAEAAGASAQISEQLGGQGLLVASDPSQALCVLLGR
ncbi:hypothetical protein [Nonomuraea candida]|uniref:hypothetical protein n=1 Tax=Nonomuraea candida TaxID=359159 RepID=UPI0005BD6A3F|nr:hypothetical protein [Nonomuraea candida]